MTSIFFTDFYCVSSLSVSSCIFRKGEQLDWGNFFKIIIHEFYILIRQRP